METTDPKIAEAAIIKAIDAQGPENKKPDIDIIDPEPEIFRLGNKAYQIKPLPIKKLKLLYKIQSMDLNGNDEAALTETVKIIGKIIEEPDLDFLEDNLDMGSITDLFTKIMNINLMAVEKKTKAMRGI